jgi:hypothetical protein
MNEHNNWSSLSNEEKKRTFPFHMTYDLCDSCNYRINGSIGPGSMYWGTLREDEDDAPREQGILTKCTYKLQNIIQN